MLTWMILEQTSLSISQVTLLAHLRKIPIAALEDVDSASLAPLQTSAMTTTTIVMTLPLLPTAIASRLSPVPRTESQVRPGPSLMPSSRSTPCHPALTGAQLQDSSSIQTATSSAQRLTPKPAQPVEKFNIRALEVAVGENSSQQPLQARRSSSSMRRSHPLRSPSPAPRGPGPHSSRSPTARRVVVSIPQPACLPACCLTPRACRPAPEKICGADSLATAHATGMRVAGVWGRQPHCGTMLTCSL